MTDLFGYTEYGHRGVRLETLAVERVEAGGSVYLVHVARRGVDGPVRWDALREQGRGLELVDVDRIPACVAARAHRLWSDHADLT